MVEALGSSLNQRLLSTAQRWAAQGLPAIVIEVTRTQGSVPRETGTRMLVAKALACYGVTHFSEGNLNNHIGAPLSLARMPASCDFGVFELGMNHAGELSPLSQLVAPDIAVITTIADSHIGHFNSLNDIAMAKAEIFDGLAHPDSTGIAMINTRDQFTPPLDQKAHDAGGKTVLRFG